MRQSAFWSSVGVCGDYYNDPILLFERKTVFQALRHKGDIYERLIAEKISRRATMKPLGNSKRKICDK